MTHPHPEPQADCRQPRLIRRPCRYLRLAWALFRYSLAREMMFKVNFLLWIVVEIAWFALQWALIEVLFHHVREIAGWNKYEMIILIGASQFIQQTFQLLFMINCIELPENVRTGKLDFCLLQPANSQFLATVRKFDIGSIANAGLGLAFVFYGVWKLGLQPSLAQILLFFFLSGNGVLIHYAVMLSIVTLSFWIVRAHGLVVGYYQLFQLTRIPREAFKGIIRIIFTFALPMLLVACCPAETLTRNLWNWNLLWITGLTLILLSLSAAWFRFALRFYTSASS
ncbi:MAG: ABC-2 family transporter protein [Verrucomicrobiae bacterium]|nr:ABC-2 family transporter protein [Verrucomicrobiae bacterium]